jgi:hypothetical protein
MINKNDFDGNLKSRGGFSKKTNYDLCHCNIDSAAHKYLTPDTHELRPDCIQERTCPMCKTAKARTLFKKNGFRHV